MPELIAVSAEKLKELFQNDWLIKVFKEMKDQDQINEKEYIEFLELRRRQLLIKDYSK